MYTRPIFTLVMLQMLIKWLNAESQQFDATFIMVSLSRLRFQNKTTLYFPSRNVATSCRFSQEPI
jgi:hypothetical protein